MMSELCTYAEGSIARDHSPRNVPDGPAPAARRLVPTERGWLMGNELYGLFWDLASDD